MTTALGAFFDVGLQQDGLVLDVDLERERIALTRRWNGSGRPPGTERPASAPPPRKGSFGNNPFERHFKK